MSDVKKRSRGSQDSGDKPKKDKKVKKNSTKSDVKPEPVSTDVKPIVTKKAKLEFDKDGQKRESPDELDMQRLFYESLYLEELEEPIVSKSKVRPLTMAEKWCMEHGLLDDDVQTELYDIYLKHRKAVKDAKQKLK